VCVCVCAFRGFGQPFIDPIRKQHFVITVLALYGCETWSLARDAAGASEWFGGGGCWDLRRNWGKMVIYAFAGRSCYRVIGENEMGGVFRPHGETSQTSFDHET
jgi:hypothetical protein